MEKWEDRCDRTPMDLNNVKILIGSVTETISRKMVLGSKAYTKALLLLNTLVYSIEYAMKQLAQGHTKYEAKIRTLKASLQKLQYECESICTYKEQYKFVTEDAKPGCVPELAICEEQSELRVPDISVPGVFTKDVFTNDVDVDKMLITAIEVSLPGSTTIEYKLVNLVGMTTPVLVLFSDISDLTYAIGTEDNVSFYNISYRLSKAGTNTYSNSTCTIGAYYARS